MPTWVGDIGSNQASPKSGRRKTDASRRPFFIGGKAAQAERVLMKAYPMRRYSCVLGFIFMASLSACASMGAENTEDTLSASGFQMKVADTPQKMALLQAMTQNKIMVHAKNGVNYYLYADAAGCHCLYGGVEANYQRYQQLRIAQNIADEQVAAAEMNQSAMMIWGGWGPWGPGFY